jgi:hypothetical protein
MMAWVDELSGVRCKKSISSEVEGIAIIERFEE